MTQYYDLVLLLIPVALAGVSGGLTIAGLSLTVAIPVAGIVAMGLIGHALFVRTPVGAPTPVPSTESPGFNSAD